MITSARLVLAGTFAALATLPLTMLTELGFAVAFGVLLDAIVVRSVLVTALSLDLGRWMWWPSALARRAPERGQLERPAFPRPVTDGGSPAAPFRPGISRYSERKGVVRRRPAVSPGG